MPRLKVMTLNLWGFRGNWSARRDRIVATMQDEELDVLLLQEVADHGWRLNQAVELASLTGYGMMYAPSQVYFPWPTVATGLAVLSRFPLANPTVTELTPSRGLIPAGVGERRVAQRVEIALDNMTVTLYNTHFPLETEARRRAACRLWELIAHEHSVLVVAGGDFNARPDETAVRFLQGVVPLDSLRGALTDAWVTAGIGPEATFRLPQPDARIDYIFYKTEPTIVVQETKVLGLGPQAMSDHAAVVATFSISPSRDPSEPVEAEPVATLEPV